MVSIENQFQIALIEHDINDDSFLVWQYPSLPYPGFNTNLEQIAIHQVNGPKGNIPTSLFMKYKLDWMYLVHSNHMKHELHPINTDINSITIVIITKTFQPEKYYKLAEVFIQQYLDYPGDPTKLLEVYLSIFTNGNFQHPKLGLYDLNKFSNDDAYLSVSCLKDLITSFGMEIVLLWNAILLKKRILVIDENYNSLMSTMRTLPQLCFHRKDWNILRPLVTSDQVYIDDLKTNGIFIAGTLDMALLSSSDLYDVVVSMVDHRITISQNAQISLKLCPIHKEVSTILTDLASTSETSNIEIINALSSKTDSIINQLKNLTGGGELSEEIIITNIRNESAQQWLYRLAVAEGLL